MKLAHFVRLAIVGTASLLASFAGSSALAQTGPIRFIVGLAPGGAVDPYARIIAEHMAKTLGRSIIVENRPGATGNLSAQFMIHAPADGEWIWGGTQTLTEINPRLLDQPLRMIRASPPLRNAGRAASVLV